MEWKAGLVFERGEPEQVVYCVEVFPNGSEYDTHPQPNTLEFAEYCEVAGWKLVDGRGKFCIFKRIREDAVPILTDQERVEYVFRASGVWAASIVVGIIMLLQLGLYFAADFEIRIFSRSLMGTTIVAILLFLAVAVDAVAHFLWKRQMISAVKKGERILFLDTAWMKTIRYFSTAIGMISILIMLWLGNYGFLTKMIIFVLICHTVSRIVAIKRPKTDSNRMIWILGAVAFGLISGAVEISFSVRHESICPPLTFEEIGIEADSEPSDNNFDEENFLGSTQQFGMFSGIDLYMGYEVYHTEYDWILDRIWNNREKQEVNDQRIDCSAEWNAEYAFRNGTGDYYVRYDNAILIFQLDEDTVLTPEQIHTVREKLELG